MKENKTKYMILGLLNHQPMSGYDIKERVDHALSMFWNSGFGQIYPTLASLTEDGNIQLFKRESKAGPDRKVYKITDQGKVMLKKWLATPTEKEEVRYEMLLKLFFSSAIDPMDVIRNIESFQMKKQAEKIRLDMFCMELEKIMDESEDHRMYYLTARFGQKVYEAYLQWAQEAMEMLKESEQSTL